MTSYGYDMFTPNDWVDVDDILPPARDPAYGSQYVKQPSTLQPPAQPAQSQPIESMTSGPHYYHSPGRTYVSREALLEMNQKIQEQAGQIQLLWIVIIIAICIIVNLRSMVSTLQSILLSRTYGQASAPFMPPVA
jgi:hypothetical protein